MSTLRELITQGEFDEQAFEIGIDNQEKIARAICAFANTKGGRILIGVKSNGKIVGCHPEEVINKLEQVASVFCKPSITFSTNILIEDFRLVLEIIIEPSNQIPHKAKNEEGEWKSFIRVEKSILQANKIVENVWKEQKNAQVKPDVLNNEELIILDCIKNEELITLSKLYRIANLPLPKIDKVIVLLICWGLIEIVYKNDSVFYKMK